MKFLKFWPGSEKYLQSYICSFSSKEQSSFNFMTVVTIHSNFGAQENKIFQCFHFLPVYLPWSDGTRCHILVFWSKLRFKPAFSLSSLTIINRLFFPSLLSPIRVVSSAYLRLLLFLPVILIPAWDSSSLAFCKVYSAWS